MGPSARKVLNLAAAGVTWAALVASGVSMVTGPAAAPPTFDVTTYGASPADAGNDTAGFAKAISAASAVGTPTAPAVVSVPPGVYRLFRLGFKSNVDVKVSSGATVEEYGTSPGPLITWDGVQNVTLEGVGGRFTMNLDPKATGASTAVMGISVLGVTNFTIAHISVIQNQSNLSGGAPDNGHAAFVYRAKSLSTEPTNGLMQDVVEVGGPKGYGPTQITGGRNLTFDSISSDGGTALRIETDGGGVLGVQWVAAHNISCTNGNKAFSLIPHGHPSSNVAVNGVSSNNCEYSFKTASGATNVTITNVVSVAGKTAQLQASGTTSWTIGPTRGCYSNGGGAVLSNVSCN